MTSNYVSYILDLLSPFGDMTSRAMFGGYCIYKDKVIVGIVVIDELYFIVDKTNQVQYEELDSVPFTYSKGDTVATLSYWKVAIEILEDEEQLPKWLEDSFIVALNSKRK